MVKFLIFKGNDLLKYWDFNVWSFLMKVIDYCSKRIKTFVAVMLELFELSRFLFGKRVPAAGIRIAEKAQAIRS